MAGKVIAAYSCPFLVCLLCLFCGITVCRGMSYEGKGGHASDFRATFEGLTGDAARQLERSVSQAIDAEFTKAFKATFGELPPGNHRILGHWGFSGDIPFNQEPYKSALQKYPRGQVAKLWQDTVNRLTQQAMDQLGLPKLQARAYMGILYDCHLLGDWKPGNQVLSPLKSIKNIESSIIKNAQRLYGRNSDIVVNLIKEIDAIKLTNPQKRAEAILELLRRQPFGEEFWKRYGKLIETKGIGYNAVKGQMTREGLLKNPELQSGKPRPGSGQISANGLLLSNGRLLVSVKQGATAGLIVFAIDGGKASYNYFLGNTLKPEYERRLTDAAVKGASVGTAVAVTVLLGASPGGFVVMGVGMGTYWIVENSLQEWHRVQDRKFLNEDDLRFYGIEIDSVLNLPSIPDVPLKLFDNVQQVDSPLGLFE